MDRSRFDFFSCAILPEKSKNGPRYGIIHRRTLREGGLTKKIVFCATLVVWKKEVRQLRTK